MRDDPRCWFLYLWVCALTCALGTSTTRGHPRSLSHPSLRVEAPFTSKRFVCETLAPSQPTGGSCPTSSALAIGLLPHDESLVIDPVYRPQIKATKHDDGSVIVRAGRSWVQFSAADLHELYAFAADRPTIQKYPSMALRPHTATNNTAVGE